MILNRQGRVRIPIGNLEQFLSRARRMLRLPADSLTICFVTDSEMARWNRAYHGKNRPTDVLSFPADTLQGRRASARAKLQASRYLGDIAIAPAVALRNARFMGRPLDGELKVLILHGILHLMGYDHETDTGQRDRRERRLRRALGLT
jgi:probable rRNA maturation factor